MLQFIKTIANVFHKKKNKKKWQKKYNDNNNNKLLGGKYPIKAVATDRIVLEMKKQKKKNTKQMEI